MRKRKVRTLGSVLMAAMVPAFVIGQALAAPDADFEFKQAQTLKSAREKQQEARDRINAIQNGQPLPEPSGAVTTKSAATMSPSLSVQPPVGLGVNRAVNINLPNFANSPNLRKFVDSLPGLGSAATNNLGQCIPVAVPDTNSYPGSDYYEIALVEYTEKMHSDLPPTKLRGYVQKNGGDPNPHYLGPIIVAQKDRAVRIKFTNMLPTGAGGNLFLPVDSGVMGAGLGPLGMNVTPGNPMNYTQNRAALHLHGGRTPWISDGTPHQWITPAGEKTDYVRGSAVVNVPDMPDPGAGSETLYWSNGQSARLMFYHDHAYGITRLNVYAGEAAGYLITDPTEQGLIASGVLPGIGVPLVIQDKTFINDTNTYAATSNNLYAAWGTSYTPTPPTDTVDPLWKSYVTSGLVGGNLWLPHEYMPNENPFDPRGYNDFGRWDYGPWMLPPMAVQNTELPSPTIIPEAYMDTMLVNGTALPYVELPPTAVRFRILNACNDRIVNLQLFKAEPLTVRLVNGGTNYVAPVVTFSGGGASVQGGATATVDLVTGAITSITVTNPGVGYTSAPTITIADTTGSNTVAFASAGTEVHMVPALANAAYLTWPSDGRPGGVPDPTTMGPSWYQIGNEGGFLAQVQVVPPQPIDFDYNRRSVTIMDMTSRSLFLLPAVRADVVVDLSSYKDGDTLIVYNDAPAPAPLYDTRNDYYTDDPDQTAIGGAPATAPGFGPNTRTVMQIRIKATAPAQPPWKGLAALTNALPKAFAAGQDKIIVPNSAYNLAYGTNWPDAYVNQLDQSLNLTGATQAVAQVRATLPGQNYTTPPTVTFFGGGGTGAVATATLNGVVGITIVTSGTGYSANPVVTITAAAGDTGTGATAAAQVTGGVISGITIINPGSNYLLAPTVTITDATGTGATATANITLGSVGAINVTSGGTGYTKAPYVYLIGGGGIGAQADALLTGAEVMTGKNLTEGFDMEYGRMNVLLGSTPNPLTPLVGLGPVVGLAYYIDPPTEYLTPETNVLWRLSHIGVDSHAMHFHLFDLQVVNRVDWTGIIKPPYPSEIGWKDTIETDPFTDLIVALRPTKAAMKLPFGLPRSSRLLDETMPAGSTGNFSTVAPPAGVAAAAQITNVVTDFGWEYVWHCHLLGHEENDMMRPIVFDVPATLPTAPRLSAATANGVTLTWTDPTPYNYATGQPASTLGNPMNEIGFLIMRGTGTAGALTQIGTALANQTTFTDKTAVGGTTYRYQVVIYNAAGSTPSNTQRVTAPRLTITTTSLPNGQLGVAYSQTLAASGGPTPYTWSLSAGALPGGLTLSTAGLISGTPTNSGTFNFTVRVADAGGGTATRALSIRVTGPIISFVRAAAATPQTPTATVTVAYPAGQTAGDLNVVVVGWNDSTSTVKSVSDNVGNVYNLAVGPTRGASLSQSIYYASGIKGGATTVTVTFSAAVPFPDIRILEYSSVNTLDKTAGASGTSLTSNSGTATTTAANELIFGANYIAGSTTGPGTGFTSRIITTPDSDIAEDRVVTGIGTYSATAPVTAGGWVMQMATFK
jgi:FtsP/CotA-like multicopper oxidase with cupredoxin domain